MDYYPIIAARFQGAMETIAMAVDELAPATGEAAGLMTSTLLADGRILACGCGVDAALAQLFCTSLMDAFEDERPALPALNLAADATGLSAIASGQEPDALFARPLRALARPGDLLLVIASHPPAPALAEAVVTAGELGLPVVALVPAGHTLPGVAAETLIAVPAESRSRAVELHTLVLHTLCQLIEFNLFGSHQQA